MMPEYSTWRGKHCPPPSRRCLWLVYGGQLLRMGYHCILLTNFFFQCFCLILGIMLFLPQFPGSLFGWFHVDELYTNWLDCMCIVYWKWSIAVHGACLSWWSWPYILWMHFLWLNVLVVLPIKEVFLFCFPLFNLSFLLGGGEMVLGWPICWCWAEFTYSQSIWKEFWELLQVLGWQFLVITSCRWSKSRVYDASISLSS